MRAVIVGQVIPQHIRRIVLAHRFARAEIEWKPNVHQSNHSGRSPCRTRCRLFQSSHLDVDQRIHQFVDLLGVVSARDEVGGSARALLRIGCGIRSGQVEAVRCAAVWVVGDVRDVGEVFGNIAQTF